MAWLGLLGFLYCVYTSMQENMLKVCLINISMFFCMSSYVFYVADEFIYYMLLKSTLLFLAYNFLLVSYSFLIFFDPKSKSSKFESISISKYRGLLYSNKKYYMLLLILCLNIVSLPNIFTMGIYTLLFDFISSRSNSACIVYVNCVILLLVPYLKIVYNMNVSYDKWFSHLWRLHTKSDQSYRQLITNILIFVIIFSSTIQFYQNHYDLNF